MIKRYIRSNHLSLHQNYDHQPTELRLPTHSFTVSIPIPSLIEIPLVDNDCIDYIPNHSLYIHFIHRPKTDCLPHSTTTPPTTIAIIIMTGFTAAFLCSILAFISLIQPCPAPPVVAGIVGGVALGAGAAIGGAAVAGNRGKKRDNTSNNGTTVIRGSRMSACMTEYVSEDAVTIQKISDTSMIIGDIAPACMEAIRAYNDDPNIVNLNAAHGTTNVINATAVLVYGVPLPMMRAMGTFLKSIPDKPVGSPTYKRRAIGGSVSI